MCRPVHYFTFSRKSAEHNEKIKGNLIDDLKTMGKLTKIDEIQRRVPTSLQIQPTMLVHKVRDWPFANMHGAQ